MTATEMISMCLMAVSLGLVVGGTIFTYIEHSKHKKFMRKMNRETRRLNRTSGAGYITIGQPRNNIAIVTDFFLRYGEVVIESTMFAKDSYKAGTNLGKLVLCGDDDSRIHVASKPLILERDLEKGEKLNVFIPMDFKVKEFETWVRVP